MSMFLALMMKTLFSWSLLSVLFGVEKSDASEMTTKFQTLDMSLLDHLSSAANPTCNRASRTGFENNRLEVVHKNSPCAAHENYEKRSKLSFAKILDNDQLRVKSIQARVAPSIKLETNESSRDKIPILPAQSHGNYIVNIGLGTPKQTVNLILDTGSDITWTQCQPCLLFCYPQNDPLFDPDNSTTYSKISFESKYCPPDPTTFHCSGEKKCTYGLVYGDGSYTYGFLSEDKLTVTPNDMFPHFLFGCGQNNDGTFNEFQDAGILGLSRGGLSFVSQTAEKYGQYFSYCLPKNISSTGFLAFGKHDDDAKMISTPFVKPPPDVLDIFYFIEITAISVGGKQLPIKGSIFKKAGTIIDSGTVITRLPLAAYNAMSTEFKNQMNTYKYKSAPAYQILDTCFYISEDTNNTKVPTVSFTFKGNATVDLDASGILGTVNSSYVCLAFAGNDDPSSFAIFGNTQQSAFEVVYDVAGNKNWPIGKLGFIKNPYCL